MKREVEVYRPEEIFGNALREFHRRMIVIEEPTPEALLDIINRYDGVRGESYSLLFAGKEPKSENNMWKPLSKGVDSRAKPEYVQFKDLNRILGTTWDALIVDLRRDMRPNDVGRVIEVVRGGGYIIVLSPERERWKNMKTPFHRDMVTSPFTLEDVETIFQRYFVESLEKHPGIFFHGDGGLVGREVRYPDYVRSPPEIPSDISFDESIYRRALTEDQVRVIKAIDKLSSMPRGSVVVTADRGRGKSAAVGLGVAGYMLKKASKKDKLKIYVTAPDPVNTKEIFSFIRMVFREHGVKHNVKKQSGVIVEINSTLGKIAYINPPTSYKVKADLIVVDEASGIPTHILEHIAEKFEKSVFSSTLHGYEGAGRGFQVRFLPMVRKVFGGRLIEVDMEEPIRYAPEDPVEDWLFKTFFLDADPYPYSEADIFDLDLSKLRYVKPDPEEWLFEKQDLLREYIGIYIYAHYRNRPNDLMILMDAPHHFMRAVMYRGHVINSLHLAYEGAMTEEDVMRTLAGDPPSGHVIPTILLRYYPHLGGIPEMRGIRVVRIATHPDVMRKGIGSKALEKVVEEAREMGMDWVGASFGATDKLLDFWWRNGFAPLYLSPVRNAVSGEFSTVVIRPLSRRAREVVKRARKEFKKLLMTTLFECHFNLEPKLAYQLLSMDPFEMDYKPNLSRAQKERLKMYIYGGMAFGGAYDAIREVVKTHFMRSPDKRVRIPRLWEYVLINRVLQARPWEKVALYFDLDMEEVVNKTRELVAKLRLYYVLKGEEDEA